MLRIGVINVRNISFPPLAPSCLPQQVGEGSLNSFIQEAIGEKLEEAAALFHSFTLVGQDTQEASVEFAHNAQQEVAQRFPSMFLSLIAHHSILIAHL